MSAADVNGSIPLQANSKDVLKNLAAELAAVPDEELAHINIDVMASVTTAYGILPKLAKLHDRIARLAELKMNLVDGLETYAKVLKQAHLDYLAASTPAEALPALSEEGTALRDRLYADVQSLIVRGVVGAEEVNDVRTSTGYRALAVDLGLLAMAVEKRWTQLAGNTPIKIEEVMNAQVLSEKLLHALGEKEQAPAVAAEGSATRSRAFALFLRSYSEVRRAVTYVRWHEGDADIIAPSLYQGRGTSKRKPDEAVVPPPPVPPVATAPATPAAPTVITAPTAAVGSPHSDPFGVQ